jgi:hypothetical protein
MAQTGPQVGGPPMGGPQIGRRRHRSFVGPLLLIVLGVAFLLANLFPQFDPWPALFRFWPLILICIGLGKIWDSYYARQHAGEPTGPWVSGMGVAWIVIAVFFILAIWHGGNSWGRGPSWEWHGRHRGHESHDTQAVELQGAKSVEADIQMPAGTLTLTGGSTRLLDADFRYDPFQGKPNVQYTVSGDHGELNLSQDGGSHVHFGTEDADWNLRLGGDVPIDLNANMGAGETDLLLRDLNVTHLKLNMGAGELHLDLTGPRKSNLDADIEGGVGEARVQLPKDVGVRVTASGGIGSVNSDGLKRDGDSYINDVYGKTPTSIDLTIHGGIGEINLVEE